MQLLKNLIYGLKILNTEGLHTVRMYIVHIVENPCSSKTCIKFCWFFLRKLRQKNQTDLDLRKNRIHPDSETVKKSSVEKG